LFCDLFLLNDCVGPYIRIVQFYSLPYHSGSLTSLSANCIAQFLFCFFLIFMLFYVAVDFSQNVVAFVANYIEVAN